MKLTLKLPSWVRCSRPFYVMSDIHGRYDEMIYLLKQKPKDVKTIILGDYVDKGKYSMDVVECLYDRNYMFLKGNHDIVLYYTMLKDPNAQEFAEAHGTYETLQNMNKFDRDLFRRFFNILKTYYTHENIVFVHSGIDMYNMQQSFRATDEDCLSHKISRRMKHPVWAGVYHKYPTVYPRWFIIHGHVRQNLENLLGDNDLCVDLGMKELCAAYIHDNTVDLTII